MNKIKLNLNVEADDIDQLLVESEKIVKFLKLQKVAIRGFYTREMLDVNYSLDIIPQETYEL